MSSEVNEVRALCPEASISEILADIKVSGSAEATINRYFDGLFLVGTERDPSLSLLSELDPVSSNTTQASKFNGSTDLRTLDSILDIGRDSDIDVGPQPTKPSSKDTKTTKSTNVIVIDDSDSDLAPQAPNSNALTFRRNMDRPFELTDGTKYSFHQSVSSYSSAFISKQTTEIKESTASNIWKDERTSTASNNRTDEITRLKTKSLNDNTKASTEFSKPSLLSKSGSLLIKQMNERYGIRENSAAFDDNDDDGGYKSNDSLTSSQKRPKAKLKRKYITRNVSESSNSSDDQASVVAIVKQTKAQDSPNIPTLANNDEKVRRAEEKERAKFERAEEKRLAKEIKDKEKEQKRLEKEQAKKAKMDTMSVNKLRDKHTAVTEMTLELDPTFLQVLPGGSKIIEKVQEKGAKINISKQPLAQAIRWSRVVTRQWDNEREVWIPCDAHVEMEPFVLVRLPAIDFSCLIRELNGVENYISHVQALYGNEYKVIVFIEGLKDLLKSRNNQIGNQVRNEVRQMGGGNSKTSKSSKNNTSINLASKEEIDAALLWLQIFGNCFVQQAESQDEVCALILSFTSSIAMIPERMSRSEQQLRINFGDSVKSGSSRQDCWRRVLMEVKPCTESVANGILREYPTYRSLMEAYSNISSQNGKEDLLADIEVDRGTSRKRIGPSMSRKICLALTSEDADLAIFDPPPAKKMYGRTGGSGNFFNRGGGNFRGRGGFDGRDGI